MIKDIRKELLGSLLKWPLGVAETIELHGWDEPLGQDLSVPFKAIIKMADSGAAIGLSSVIRQMQIDDPKVNTRYYTDLLKDCLEQKKPTGYLKAYVDEIKGQLTADKIRDMMMEVGCTANQEHTAPEVLIDMVQSTLDEINSSIACTEEITLDGACDSQYAEFEKFLEEGESPVMSSGLCGLDKLIKGYKAGQYILMSAMSSVGKSALATSCIIQQHRRGIRGAFISLEMDAPSLTNRLVQQVSGFDVDGFYANGFFLDHSGDRVEEVRCKDRAKTYYKEALERLKRMNIRTAHPRNPTLASIKSILRQMKKDGIEIAYIDYVQLIIGDKKVSREREISEISDTLRRLAIELKMVIVVLAQQNGKALESGPQSQFVRECAQVKNDAFICILINNDTKGNRIDEIIVDKNRQGRKGKFPIEFNGPMVSFVSNADTGVVAI